VIRAPAEAAETRAEISRRDQKRQREALAAATAEYRRLSPAARCDQLAVSGEVNRMIAAAINVDPKWFWHGPEA
jgi:FixJ family two-component response regulator